MFVLLVAGFNPISKMAGLITLLTQMVQLEVKKWKVLAIVLPDVWHNIKLAYKSPVDVPQFNNAQIVSYFVTRTVSDGLQAGDFKSVNQSAVNLFRCGHVQQIEVSSLESKLFVRAKCLPEMRKDRVYKVLISLSTDTTDILTAECGCPGGRGPTASCKHIAALCYAFQNFCECGVVPDFLTCTEKLQELNKPRSRNVDPIPVVEIRSHQQTINCRIKKPRCSRTPSNFDPRPINLHQPDSEALETLRCDLINLDQPCAFTKILIPSVDKVLHDHSYSNQRTAEKHPQRDTFMKEPCPLSPENLSVQCEETIRQLQVTPEERTKIELLTRQQSKSPLWHEVRFKRLTGWKSSQILKQESWTPALLRNILYPKPLNQLQLQLSGAMTMRLWHV